LTELGLDCAEDRITVPGVERGTLP
jgi:hypothetical protein